MVIFVYQVKSGVPGLRWGYRQPNALQVMDYGYYPVLLPVRRVRYNRLGKPEKGDSMSIESGVRWAIQVALVVGLVSGAGSCVVDGQGGCGKAAENGDDIATDSFVSPEDLSELDLQLDGEDIGEDETIATTDTVADVDIEVLEIVFGGCTACKPGEIRCMFDKTVQKTCVENEMGMCEWGGAESCSEGTICKENIGCTCAYGECDEDTTLDEVCSGKALDQCDKWACKNGCCVVEYDPDW